jgi:hypothetical protein
MNNRTVFALMVWQISGILKYGCSTERVFCDEIAAKPEYS